MDYIYTTNGQSGREENGTMYNGRGLGRKGIGAGQRSSAGCQRSVKGFEDVSKASKTFRGMLGTSKRYQGASKGCPMTITPPSRSWQLNAMGAPGGGQICRRETNAVKTQMTDCARGTGVQAMEVGESVGSMEVSSGFPGVFTDTIALPLDEIVHLTMQNLAIEDLFDVELFVIIDEFRWKRVMIRPQQSLASD